MIWGNNMRKSQITFLIILFLVIVTGIIIILTIDRTPRIYTMSFDREVKFELARTNVQRLDIQIDQVGIMTTFYVDDFDVFLLEYVYNNPYYIETVELVNPNTSTEISLHLFVYEGYPFILSVDSVGTIVFEPNYTAITDLGVLIPFITNYYYSSNTLIEWNDIVLRPFSSFQEAVTYYEKIGDFLYQVDYEQTTIYLKCVIERLDDYREYGIENFYEMSLGYPIALVFSNDGFTIEMDVTKINSD